jgi:hypothetical protein
VAVLPPSEPRLETSFEVTLLPSRRERTFEFAVADVDAGAEPRFVALTALAAAARTARVAAALRAVAAPAPSAGPVFAALRSGTCWFLHGTESTFGGGLPGKAGRVPSGALDVLP